MWRLSMRSQLPEMRWQMQMWYQADWDTTANVHSFYRHYALTSRPLIWTKKQKTEQPNNTWYLIN